MLIYVFCKSCEHDSEPEIVFVYFIEYFFVLIFLNNFRFETMFTTLTKHVNNQTYSYCFGKFEENMDLSHIHLVVIIWDNAYLVYHCENYLLYLCQ